MGLGDTSFTFWTRQRDGNIVYDTVFCLFPCGNNPLLCDCPHMKEAIRLRPDAINRKDGILYNKSKHGECHDVRREVNISRKTYVLDDDD